MPREFQSGFDEWLARKDKQSVSHTTLSVLINNGDLLRQYRFASSSLVIDGVEYEPLLRRGFRIKSSLTRAADLGEVDLTNVDTELGKEFLGLGDALYGAEAVIGKYWKDLDSGAVFVKEFLVGPLIGLTVDENVAHLTATSEPYANINVGPTRIVDPACQWLFRQADTCGYAGSLLTCNLMINHINGCEGRHGGGTGNSLKRAKFGGFPFTNAASRFKVL